MKVYIFATVIILSLTEVSCSGKEERLVYAYQDRIVDTLSIIAVEKGFMGSQIDSKIFSSDPQTAEALISRSAHVAAMGDSATIILLSKYDNFVIIASHGNGSLRHRVIAANSVEIKTWQDLQNKKIGIKKGNISIN